MLLFTISNRWKNIQKQTTKFTSHIYNIYTLIVKSNNHQRSYEHYYNSL